MVKPQQAWSSSKLTIIGVFSFALLLRFLLFAAIPDHSNHLLPDSSDYIKLSESISSSGEYKNGDDIEIFRAPGYPLFLVFCGYFPNKIVSAIIIQILLDAFLSLLIWRTSLLITKNHLISFAAAALHAISISSIVHTQVILSETLLTFSFVVIILLFETVLASGKTNVKLNLSGLLFGIATLFRAVCTPLLPLFIFRLFLKTKSFVKITLFLLPICLIIGGWVYRNHHTANYNGYSSVSSLLLYRYSACALLAKQNQRSFEHQQSIMDGELKGKNQQQQAVFAQKKGIEILSKSPLTYGMIHLKADINNFLPAFGGLLQLLGQKVGNNGTLSKIHSDGIFAAVPHFFNNNYLLLFLSIPAVILLLLKYFGCLVGIFYCLADLLKKRRQLSDTLVFFVFIIEYFMLVPGLAATPRFRVPAEPFIAIMAAYGFYTLFSKKLK